MKLYLMVVISYAPQPVRRENIKGELSSPLY